MKIYAILLLSIAVSLGIAPVDAKEPLRINGATEASFESSFAKMVRSLKAPERRALALGLFGVLLKHECLAPETVFWLTFFPVEPRDGRFISPCRQHLQNMSYPDILQAGKPQGKDATSELPNNSFNPMPLRGTG